MSALAVGAIGAEIGANATLPRVAFYSHDSLGLGHVRRNLGLARALSALPRPPQILLVAGTCDATRLEVPPGTDVVVLPGVQKDRHGEYRPRRFDARELDRVLALRAAASAGALTAFDPDVLVVDRYARGFRGELEPALEALAARGTRVILGIRDVIDGPEAVRAHWADDAIDDALARWFTAVLAFTDPRVVHPLAPLAGRRPVPVHATGYLVPAPHDRPAPSDGLPTGESPYVLCTVGGGADGRDLALAVVEAPMPDGVRVVVLTGPQMPVHHRQALEARARDRGHVTIVEMVRDPRPLLESAAAVIAMAGYNTASELLATDVPALLVPRPFPREEQRIRARAFAAHGLVDVLEGEEATPAGIGAWVARAVAGPRVDRSGVDRAGHHAAAAFVSEMLATPRR